MIKCGFSLAAGLGTAVLLMSVWATSSLADQASPEATRLIEHIVQEGDNLHLIAGYYYKDPRQWKKIYSMNRDVISNPNRIFPDEVLEIKVDPFRQWDIPYAEFVARVYQ